MTVTEVMLSGSLEIRQRVHEHESTSGTTLPQLSKLRAAIPNPDQARLAAHQSIMALDRARRLLRHPVAE
jgi:hypothetical protein